jgi:TonB family protein
MDENRHWARREARRRFLAAWAASLAIHAALFTLLFAIPSPPASVAPPLEVSLEGGEMRDKASGSMNEIVKGATAAQTEARSASTAAPGAAPGGPSSAGQQASPASIAGIAADAVPTGAADPGGAGSGSPGIGGAGSGSGSSGIGGASVGDGNQSSQGIGGAGSGARGTDGDQAAALAARVGAAIEARKTYPEAARRRGTEGVVRLALRVSADGALVAARLTGSSGSPLLDRAALDLASSVFPVDNLARRELELELSVRYGLTR